MYFLCAWIFKRYSWCVHFILYCLLHFLVVVFLLIFVCWRFLCVVMCTIYLLLEYMSVQYLWCAPTILYPFIVQGRGNQTVSTHHTYNSAVEFLIKDILYVTQNPSTICLCNLSGGPTFYIHRPDSIRSSNF